MNVIRNCSAFYLPISIFSVLGFFGWLLISDRFQTSSPRFKLLANFGPPLIPFAILAVIVIVWLIAFWLVLAFTKVVGLDCLVGCLIAFGLIKPLVLIVHSFPILVVQSFSALPNRYSWSVVGSISRKFDWSVNCWFNKLVDLIGLDLDLNLDSNWLIFLISFLQSFFWAVQDGIIFLNNHASTSDLYQNHLCISRDYLDKLLDLFSLWSLPASIML